MANGGQINYSVKFTTDKKDLDELQQRLRDITIQAANPGEKANDSLQKASQTAERLLTIISKSFNQDLGSMNVTKFNTELTKGNLTLANVKRNLEGVKGGATAFNLLSSSILGANVQLKTTNAMLDRMAVTLKNTIRYGISSSIYNNFANSFAKAYDYVVDLDKSLNDIRIVTGLSAEKMETFAVNANNAAKNLGANTLDYTNAALIYYQQGLSDSEVTARAEATVKAANVTGQTGEAVSEQLTAVWNGYKVSAAETELYVDKLAAVAASTAADLEELSTGMSKVASAANIMGVDIDQLNAQLATIVSVTRQAPESVGTALKTIYSRMGDIKAGLDDETTLGNYTAKMAELGVNVLDANGNLRDMGEVIEEIGGKWNTMSREQQVALSRTMGGARQYNQLLALFDNWDMYTDALETSKNAAGELQREQDIYMDSTVAHLKKLKATWQDVYGSLLDTKEINPLIDLFSNMVQSLDNFVDAFGGGAKSIAAFGTIIANVFNKQISNAINNFVHNKTIAEQNMNSIALKQQQLTTGASMSEKPGKASPYDDAIEARTKSQEEHARKIMMIQHGINEEKQKELINMQNEIASLEEQATLIEKQAEANLKKVMGEEKYQEYLKMTFETEDQRSEYWQKIRDDTDKETKELESQYELLEHELNDIIQKKALEEDILDTNELISQIKSKAAKDERKEIVDITKNLNLNKLTVKQKTQLLQASQKVVDKQKEEQASLEASADAAEEVTKAKEKVSEINLKKDQMETDFDNMIDQGQKALSVSEQVMTLTSSLSSLAMSWSTINSLFQTWNDENATLGDKITQTITTIAFTLPTLITVYKNLKALSASYQVSKMKELALEELAQGAKVKNVAGTEAEILVENLYNKSKATGNILTKDEIKNKLIEIGVIQGETAAINGATVAQNAFNASIWANPLTWVLALLAAAVAGFSAYATHAKKAKEEQKKWNEETIAKNQAEQEELNNHKQLYESYLSIYQAYKDGSASKEEMARVTNDLIDILGKERVEIANLTGDYEGLANQIIKTSKLEAERNVNLAKDTWNRSLLQFNDEGGNNYSEFYQDMGHMRFDVGQSEKDETKVLDYFKKQGIDVWNAQESANSTLFRYAKTKEAINTIESEWNSEDFIESETYQNAKKWLAEHEETVKQMNDASETLLKETIRSKVIDQDFDSYEEYEKWMNQNLQGLVINTITKYGITDYSWADAKNEAQNILINKDAGYARMFSEAKIEKTEDESEKYRQTAGLNKTDSEMYSNVLSTLDKGEEIKGGSAEDNFLLGIEKKYKDYFDNLKIMYGENYRESEEYWTAIKDLEQQAENDRIENLQKASETERNTLHDNLDSLEENLKYLEENAEDYNKTFEKMWAEAESDPNFNWNQLDDLDESMDEATNNAEASIESLKGQLIDLTAEQYQIKLAIDADIQSDFDNITSEFERVSVAANMIGEDFKVSAENLEELNAAFPGILEGMDILADGSAQLKESSVRDAMETAQAQIKYDTDQTVAKLENQRNELLAKADAAHQIAEIAAKLAQGETMTAEDAANVKQQLQILEQTNSENVANDEKGYSKDVADTGAKNATSMTKSYQEAYMQMSKDSAQWAENSKKNMLVATTGVGTATSGGFKTNWSISNSSGIITTTNTSQLKSTDTIDTSIDWAEVEQYYRDLEQQYLTSASNTQGKIAEILARNNKTLSEMKNGARGKGASGGKSGSSKEKEAKTIELTKNEVDRYHQVDTTIEKLSNDLDKLENSEEKAFGGDWVAILIDQLKNLNQQVDTYKEKLQIARGEQSELRNELAKQGVQFNANGTVANYTQALNAQLAQLNALEAQYNSLSAAQQEQWDNNKIIDNAKESFATFKDHLDRYDELVSNFIPEIEQKIQDAIDEMVEKQIERFNKGIDLRLDMAEAERDWNKFKTNIIDGIDEDDIIGQTEAKLRDFATYYDENSTGSIQALTKHLNDTLAEIEKATSNVYGEDNVKEFEDLQKYYEELMDEMEGVFDLQKEIHEAYIDMMDEAQDKFDEQIKTYETISDLIEHDMNLIELVYGESSYNELAQYYNKQEENYKNQIDFQRQQADFWREAMEQEEEGSEAWNTARDNWIAATADLNDLIEQSIENLQDKYLNAINGIFQNLNDEVTNGKGLDYIDTEWQLINKEADKYLDTVNQLFETQALENKYLEAIDQTDNVAAQRKLKELMDEELTALKEKDKLTKYDIERANKRYEIALKQIALEEAQQNKSTMRLRRDSQGNYRYEYVADNDAVDKARDELEKLKNDLYNFDKEQYQDSLGEMYDTWVEYQEALKEAAQINDPEERAAKEALIKQHYGDAINHMLQDNDRIRHNLEESAFEDLAILYNEDVKKFTNMTDAEKNVLMNDLVPAWGSGVQEMIDTMIGAGGFYPVCEEAFEQLGNAQDEYAQGFGEIQKAAKQSFAEIATGVDTVIEKTTGFLQNNTTLIEAYNNNFGKMKTLLDTLNNLSTKFSEIAGYAKDTAKNVHDALVEFNGQNADAYDEDANNVTQDDTVVNAIDDQHNPTVETEPPTTFTDNSAPAPSQPTSYKGIPNISGHDELVALVKAIWRGDYDNGTARRNRLQSLYGAEGQKKIQELVNATQNYKKDIDSRLRNLGYDTGGYTGSWNNSGKLAFLHQKELVLNATDTENMLNAVSVMRNLTNSVGIATLARLASLGASGSAGIGGNGLEQNVHISATFPNATSTREIEEALLNLTNRASQMIGRR